MSIFLYERLKTLMEEAFLEIWGECYTVMHLEFSWYYKEGMCWQGQHECSWHHKCCNCELHCSWWNNLAQAGNKLWWNWYMKIPTWRECRSWIFKCVQGLEKGIRMFKPHGVCARSYNYFENVSDVITHLYKRTCVSTVPFCSRGCIFLRPDKSACLSPAWHKIRGDITSILKVR